MTHKKNLFFLILLLALLSAVTSCGSSRAASNSIKSLRKMAGAVEMGLNSQEYTKRMIDLKAEIEENLPQISEGELKQEIKLALDAYVDAKTVWADSETNNIPAMGESFMMMNTEPSKSIFEKYKVPVFLDFSDKKDVPNIASRKIALSTIWGAAQQHIEKAEQLSGQK